jgi:tripartite-type tricarboxylate transporter receptor subunit TctC
MMVPWPAGGGSDFAARILSKEMGASLGQNIIVENAPGAGGSLGTSRALRAPADGHTLILSTPIDMILAPLTFASATYKADEAKTIAFVGRTDLMIVTRKDLPVANLAELVALMKTRADKPLSYCSPGIGSLYHLVGERLNAAAGVKSLHVPYSGFPQCVNDLVGGQVDFAYLAIGGPFPGFVDNGNIKGIAVLGTSPSSRLPKLPLASATKGFEGFVFSIWVGLHVNGKVPDAAAEVLNKAAYAVLAKPEVRSAIEQSGAMVGQPMNLQQAQAAYLEEIKLYEGIAKSVGLTKQ